MTDSVLSLHDQTQIARAIIASVISDNEDISYANPKLIENGKVDKNQQYLTLLKSNFVGYPLSDELLPLAQILSGESLNRTEEQKEIGLTKQDHMYDDANAMLHDHLINISPPFALETKDVMTMPIINRVYEKALKEATFAGKISNENSTLFEEAMNLLLVEDEEGDLNPTKAYTKYEEFEEQTVELLLEIEKAKKSNQQEIISILENKLARLNVKWKTIGKKNKIENALKLINDEDEGAGFEDERIRFQKLFHDKTQGRLASDLRFGTVQLSPLAMLFDLEDNSLWHKITLDSDAVLKAIGPRERKDFDIDVDDLHSFVEKLSDFNFEYTSCMVRREWLDSEFLEAKYWKQETMISDGKGNGVLPTLPKRIFFIRNVNYALKGQYEVSDIVEGHLKFIKKGTPKNRIKLYKEKEPKLLKQMKHVNVINQKLKSSQSVKNLKKMIIANPSIIANKAILSSNLFNRFNNNTKPNNSNKNKLLMIVTGLIKAEEGANLDVLTLSYHDINADGSLHHAKPIKLSINGEDTARFTLQKKNRRTDFVNTKVFHVEKLKGIRVVLRGQDGTPIKEKDIIFNSFSSKTRSNLKWNIETSKQVFELASAERPTLAGYGIVLNDIIPNPDLSLEWE